MEAVIWQAIDALPADQAGVTAAVAAILADEPMEVPADPSDLRRGVVAARDRIPE